VRWKAKYVQYSASGMVALNGRMLFWDSFAGEEVMCTVE
jgi:hypothetical protein